MKKFFVISHTHWDREWYMTFEQFRIRLVDLMDHLLTILEEQPNYIFNLDAQTIILEDYLEIRPSRRPIIERYIRSGNIITGPWYLQNDFNLTSGEATIRNLQKGIHMALSFGATQRVGYAPDQFGHISQIPQIMKNFGIDSYVFGRGYKHYERTREGYEVKHMPTEFMLEGPDGSTILAIYLKEWYNNGQRLSTDIDKVIKQFDINSDRFESYNVTPYILMMNGVDHLEPQANVLEIIQRLKGVGFDVEQTSLEHYVDEVKSYIDTHRITPYVYRDVLNKGDDYSLLRGTWSSRVLQKTMNVRGQDALENQLEPLLITLENAGFKTVYDMDYMNFMWELLMKNHPHDSICGCSRDEVHKHIENRYSELKEITDAYIDRSMELASNHGLIYDKDNYTITVFNSIDLERDCLLELKLEFLSTENIAAFAIYTRDNIKLDYVITRAYQDIKDVVSPVNLPGVLDVDVYHILLKTPVVEAYSFDQYVIIPHEQNDVGDNSLDDDHSNTIENDAYRVFIEDQRVHLELRKTRRVIKDFITIIDEMDRGDSYVFEPTSDRKIKAKLKDFHVKKHSDLKQIMTLNYEIETPSHYDFASLKPAATLIKTRISVDITLTHRHRIDIDYAFDNMTKDHRLRFHIDSAITREGLIVDSPFDVRHYQKTDASIVSKSQTFCNTSFAAKKDKHTFAIFTEGQHEVEEVGSDVAVTVLRSTGYIARVEDFKPCAGELFSVPENQLLRRIQGRLGVMYAQDDLFPSELFKEARAFRNPLLSRVNSADPHKFLGGRFAVQDSSIAELFYLDDPYKEESIFRAPRFKLHNHHIVVSSYRMNDHKETVLRLVNLSESEQTCLLDMKGHIHQTNMMEDQDIPIDNALHFRPKEIKTIKVYYG